MSFFESARSDVFGRMVLLQILDDYHFFNRTLFSGRLKSPVFHLHQGQSRYGFWQEQGRIISLSEDLCKNAPWFQVQTVLKHEMLHQHISENMQGQNLAPHGEFFQSLARDLNIESHAAVGLDNSDSVAPNNAPAPSRILEKVRKLFSLAQSPNPHEAESAMRMAHELMRRWNIQELNHHPESYAIRQLGSPSRISAELRVLSQILRDHFFVEVLWVSSFDAKALKKGRVLEIMGKAENVEIAEYAYLFLLRCSRLLWWEHRKTQIKAHRGNYVTGLFMGFYEKLEEDAKKVLKNEDKNTMESLPVWTGDLRLHQHFRRRHPRIRTMSSSRMKVQKSSLEAGKEEGKKIVIHHGLKKGGTPKKQGQLNEGRFLN